MLSLASRPQHREAHARERTEAKDDAGALAALEPLRRVDESIGKNVFLCVRNLISQSTTTTRGEKKNHDVASVSPLRPPQGERPCRAPPRGPCALRCGVCVGGVEGGKGVRGRRGRSRRQRRGIDPGSKRMASYSFSKTEHSVGLLGLFQLFICLAR